MEIKLDKSDLTKLMNSAKLILPIVKLNAVNSVNGLEYLLNKLTEIGKGTLMSTISDTNEIKYKDKINKYKLDLNSDIKANSIAKVIHYQLIAEEAEKDIAHILSCIYNFRYRGSLMREVYSTCPSSSSIHHVFDLFRQSMLTGPNDKVTENTVDLLPRLGMSILYADED